MRLLPPAKIYERKYTVRTEGIRITFYVVLRSQSVLEYCFFMQTYHALVIQFIRTPIRT